MKIHRLTVDGKDYFLPDPIDELRAQILKAIQAGGGYVNIPPLRGGPGIDILFSPSGAVIGPGAANSKIIFWVRDTTLPNITDGEPTLICIYTRSGALAAHPVDVNNTTNPYSFTEDGRSSGK